MNLRLNCHFVIQFFFYILHAQQKTVVNIHALTTITQGETGRGIIAAQRLYLNQLNKNITQITNPDNIFYNYEFNLLPLDAAGDSVTAMKYAFQLLAHENKLIRFENSSYREVTIPLILGTPWSSLSAIASPILGGFNFGQISSATTSVELSDSENFPYFYRTVPSDNVQAEAIIKLCTLFDWNTIGIMYVNDNYGVYLAVSILDLALDESIETYSISFEQFDETSYVSAAKQIKQLGMF